MPANFTSGWLGNSERAWHGLGVVTEGTLPAREAFETADALFTVEKRPLFFYGEDTSPSPTHGEQIPFPTESFAVVRTDTEQLLGVVSKQYEIVQNDSLLRMADFLREETDLDSVVVLANGAKVCFTATLRGTQKDIIPGDTVKRRIVGYLGHDGKTGCGAKFTDIRVVCQNTLAAALMDSGAHRSITHKNGANAQFDVLIQSINVARQDFDEQVDLMKEFSRTSMGIDGFRDFVDEVYNIEDGQVFRKRDKLEQLFRYGKGMDFAPFSVWNGVNAITELETSTLSQTSSGAKRQFARANFGAGYTLSKKAMTIAKQLVTA